MTPFEFAFSVVVGEEGGYGADPRDPGNWTGGRVGVGECKGTCWGISAAAYPTLDIRNLTQAAAHAIYRPKYWDAVRGDDLPPPLALLVFDAAVNNGDGRAARWLQQAVGATVDGQIGEATLAAVRAHAGDGARLMTEFMARRLVFMASLDLWKIDGLGFARRLCGLPYEAMRMPADTTTPGA